MRIALDHTAAASHWPGVGRYGRELVRALVRRETCPELVLFEHGHDPALPEAALGLTGVVGSERVERLHLGRSRRLLAWQARLGLGGRQAPGGAELVHQALPGLPPGRLGGVPRCMPLFELPPPGDPAADAALARQLAGLTRIVVGSDAGMFEASERLGPHGLETWRLRAVTTGADHWLRDARPRGAGDLVGAGPPRLLVLGSVARARRPLAVLAGFERLCARLSPGEQPLLHFDGRPGDAAAELRAALADSPVAARVTWNPTPDEAALPNLVAGSTALVHLSVGELSPVTPLEACHFGTAVVASALPAFEIPLDGEVLLDPAAEADPEALADGMLAALGAGLDEEQRSLREALASFYTWDACAADHLAVWREALEDPELEA